MEQVTSSNEENDLGELHMVGCNCPSCSGSGDNQYFEDQASGHEPHTGVAGSGEPGDGTVGKGDAVGALLASGTSWNANNPGAPVQITYTMDLSNWQYSSHSYGASNVGKLSNAQKNAARESFDMFESVANIDFVESNQGNDTDIVLRQADLPSGIAGWAAPWTSGNQIAKVDVLFDRDYTANPNAGTHPYMTFIHEIGHAIGLSHPGNYNGHNGSGGTEWYDSFDSTVMSYYVGDDAAGWRLPVTPMIYDIAAVQELYGANHNYNAGDNVYDFTNLQSISMTIWDGAGNDTYTAASADFDVTFDLREGLYNITKVGWTYIWTAFGANIENAIGGSGNDLMTGNDLGNLLDGGIGADTLAGGAGDDTLAGGAGNDTYNFQTGDGVDHISDTDGQGLVFVGNVQISGTAAANGANSYQLTVNGQVFNLAIVSGALEITLNANDKIILDGFDNGDFGIFLDGDTTSGGDDTTSGGDDTTSGGDDTTSGGDDTTSGGDDTTSGGDDTTSGGDDTTSGGDDTTSGGGDDDTGGDTGGDTGDDTGGSDVGGDSTIHGTAKNDKLYGDDQDNTIYGYGKNDKLYGGDGDDFLDGGTGNDKLYGENGNDYLEGGEGRDRMEGDAGNDTLMGGADRDNMRGGEGNDRMEGGDDNDKLRGDEGDDYMSGDAGNDQLRGDEGSDTLMGGDGDDRLDGNDGDDFIFGGAGEDRARGGDGNDMIEGGAGDDNLRGDDGNDTINGGAGDDRIDGGKDDDVIYGGAGDDQIKVKDGDNFIFGEAGNDDIRGGKGNDIINAGDGDDELYGGNGNDILTGGAGADIFKLKGKGFDTITDFEQGVDLIDASGNIEKLLQTKVWYDSEGAHIYVNKNTVVDVLGVNQLTVDDFI